MEVRSPAGGTGSSRRSERPRGLGSLQALDQHVHEVAALRWLHPMLAQELDQGGSAERVVIRSQEDLGHRPLNAGRARGSVEARHAIEHLAIGDVMARE